MSAPRPGLCSVTLRAESIEAVAALAGECGLRAIEWGGDVHVPPGDLAAAARARAASSDHGLTVASYGSYLLALGSESRPARDAVLDTAVALGAPNVRVWATFGAEPGSDGYRGLVESLTACTVEAAERGLAVSLEYHGGTPTATVAGALALLDAVDASNLFVYWQPPYWRGPTEPAADAAEVAALGDRLSHLHVYEWVGAEDRRPLAEGAPRWTAVLAAVSTAGWSGPRCAFLEFVPDDAPDALRRDAAVLRSWLSAGISGSGA